MRMFGKFDEIFVKATTKMIQLQRSINPPTTHTRNHGDSDSILICSIIYNNKKYGVEGRKFGTESIYWDVEALGFVITSSHKPIVFSSDELNTHEYIQTFTMWQKAGINLLR